LVDLEIRGDARVVVPQRASQLDYRNHIRRDLTVLHGRSLQIPLEAGAGRCDSDAVEAVRTDNSQHSRPAGWGLSADTRGRRQIGVVADMFCDPFGYGRSSTVLSNLIQFGLVEKTGKNEVRVTRRAVDIIYPDTEASKSEALLAAAREPELFRAISERFTDGMPSEAALESYLIRQGFTHTAVGPATRAYRETFLFIENAIGSESYPARRGDMIESQSNQPTEGVQPMYQPPLPTQRSAPPAMLSGNSVPAVDGYEVRLAQKAIWLSGVVRTQTDADDLIAAINALKPMLPAPEAAPEKEGGANVFG